MLPAHVLHIIALLTVTQKNGKREGLFLNHILIVGILPLSREAQSSVSNAAKFVTARFPSPSLQTNQPAEMFPAACGRAASRAESRFQRNSSVEAMITSASVSPIQSP
jgi:hypothetical protein